MKKGDPPIVVEQTFDARVEDVWKAITEIDLMRQWYFDNIPAFRPEVGFETQFSVTSEARDFQHMWRVTEVVPHQKIAYDWRYGNFPGDGFVVFELSRQGDLTSLTLTCHVRETFPDDIPEFRRESCIGGWEYFIQKSLKEYLERTQ